MILKLVLSVIPSTELAALATTGNVLEKKNLMSHPRCSEPETEWAGPEIHGPCDSCFMLV